MSSEVRSLDLDLREAARILNVWIARDRVDTTRRALARWAAETASQTPRLPKPDKGLQTLLTLGLATVDSEGSVRATGALDGVVAADVPDRFPVSLRHFVFEQLLQQVACATVVREALGYAVLENGVPLVPWSAIPTKAQRNPAWVWLQELELATHDEDVLRLDERLRAFIVEAEPAQRVISQTELEERLAAQRERAWLAEDLVVQRERERLLAAGAPEYAEAVRRISIEDALAGYDIESYEIDGRPRSIEVKCSAGERDRFFLSRNERETASRLGTRYWIAWVAWGSRLPRGPCEIAWFQDPSRLLLAEGSPWRVSYEDAVVTLVADDADWRTA